MSVSLFARLARKYDPERIKTDLTRRDLLKGGLAASAAILLSDLPVGARPRVCSTAPRKILVIGAGFAGLACAFELLSAGYNVTVLEGRNRVGGRVLSFTDMIPGRVVEGGGELIGQNHPTWQAYRQRFNLEFLPVSEADEDPAVTDPIYLRGQLLINEQGRKLYEDMDAILSAITAEAAEIDADEPWKSPKAAELDGLSMSAKLKSMTGFDDLAMYAVATQLETNNAVPLDNQSYLGNLVEIKGGGGEAYWTDSETHRCKGGNASLATALAAAIGAERLLLESIVKSISIAPHVATVRLTDDRVFEADDVVLTAPPSVWNEIAFEPALPADLNPQMGTAVKFLAEVKSRFWEPGKLSPDAFGDTVIPMTWEGTDGQEGDGHACLTGFSGGSFARRLRDQGGKARDAAKTEMLRYFPGFAEAYVSDRYMDWPATSMTRGAYSFPAPGQITAHGPILQQGIGGRLHFAGEHCCYKFVGYMEGGLNSGVSVAKRIAARDGVRIGG